METLPTASVPAARPGTLLGGKYRVERELARGGMGTVVIATHLKLDRLVAIKLLGAGAKDHVAARFLREARAAARLRGEHVVRIIDLDETADGTPYLVMELLEGVDLEHILNADGKVDPARAVNWALQACTALAEAHARGVVHRDVKPSNLFRVERVDGAELIKLLDFGISKMVDEALHLTRTATVLGSPMFMSPEQLLDPRAVDRRSDIWSLGVSLYRLLSNRAPFDGLDASSVAAQIAARLPVPIEEVVPGLPAALSAAVMRCLEKDPAQRWPSVVALAEALDPFRDPRGVGSAEAVRLAEAHALASQATPPSAAPARASAQNLTLSHDLPRAPLAISPMVQPPPPRPVSVPSGRAAAGPALLVVALLAAAGLAFIATREPAAVEPAPEVAAPPSIAAAAPEVPVAEPSRPDAGVVARARPARPHPVEARDPAEMELK